MSEESKIRPVKLIQAWGGHPEGKVFTEMPSGQAEVLRSRGFAEYADGYEAPENRMLGGKKNRQRITKG